MAELKLTIPDPLLPRMLEAFAQKYHYNAATDGTKAQFAKARLRDFAKSVLSEYETQLDIDATAAAKAASLAVDLAGVT